MTHGARSPSHGCTCATTHAPTQPAKRPRWAGARQWAGAVAALMTAAAALITALAGLLGKLGG